MDDEYGLDDNIDIGQPVSIKQQLKQLSCRSWLLIVYMIISAGSMFVLDIELLDHYALFIIFLMAHAALMTPLVMWWVRYKDSCPLDVVVRAFGLGYTVMLWGVILGSTGMELICGALGTFGALIVPAARVGMEELCKVLVARRMKGKLDVNRETKTHQIAYTATSIGFATTACTTMLVWFAIQFEILAGSVGSSPPVLAMFAIAAIVGVSAVLHILSGYWIGLNTTLKMKFVKVGLEPMIFRSAYTYQLLAWALIIDSMLCWIPIMLTSGLIIYIMNKRIKAVEAELPQEYLQRVGYLPAYGYGMLAGSDDIDEFEIPNTGGAHL